MVYVKIYQKGAFMTKKSLFFLFLLINTIVNPTIVNNITLPEPRIQNLVICNDSQEFYINEKEFPLPWNKVSGAISSDLLYALSAEQLVLSTKSLWHNVQFLAQLWLDFATLSAEQITQKYLALSKESATNFNNNLKEYQPCIIEIHRLYEIINTEIQRHSSQSSSQISHYINTAMKSAWDQKPIWLQNKKIADNLINLFTFFTLYQLTLANNYTCKDISNDFILFIPQKLLQVPKLDDHLLSVTTQPNSSNADIYTGIRHSHYPNYPYKNPITTLQAQTLAKTLTVSKKIGNFTISGSKDLGSELYTLLNEILIKKSSLKNLFQDHFAEIIPNFNIFIAGHGSLDYTTANISMTIITKNKTVSIKSKTGKLETKKITYQSSDFLDILKLLNNQVFMKSLTISSCYQSGKKIKDEFNITSKLNNPILEEITYPIILLGSTLAPTTATFWLSNLPPFHNRDISNSIYIKQKLYGPSKIDGQEAFIRFFNFLNGNAVYEKFETTENGKKVQRYRLQSTNKKHPSIETFSHAKPSYLFAANVFANIYDERKTQMNQDQFANYILIKFPHTAWFTPARFKKLVLKLSQVNSLTKAQIIVPQDIQAILMDANYIPTNLFMQQQNPISFIPINYLNQNYVFDSITVTSNISLHKFLEQFFTIENIGEPINIVIKNLKLSNQTFSEIYIFIHNDFGIKGVRNGYIVTDTTGETFITYWNNNQPYGFEQQTEPYSTTERTKLIASITKNATKQFNSSVKEFTSKSGKKYEIETSGSASKETIQQLQAKIIARNSSTKAKDMFNRSRKQKEDEQAKNSSNAALINALELAHILKR